MNYLDSHCHINDAAFKDDLAIVLDNMAKADVKKALIVSSFIEDYQYAKTIKHPELSFKKSLGIYPDNVDECNDETLAAYYQYFKEADCAAIGEIGLDYHWNNTNRKRQQYFFDKQLSMAEELGKPVIIHTRDAAQDTYDILKRHHCQGVMHCFSEKREMAKLFLKLGYYLSFSGTITFKNAKEPPEVVKITPLERLLVETDCPYMAPVPLRGKRNEPSFVVHTTRKVAELLMMDEEELLRVINHNYDRLFGE